MAKLRTGDSNDRLSCLFNMPRSTLEMKMAKCRECLVRHFVPLYQGLSYMSRQDIASRNTFIPNGLFGNPTSSIEDR